MFEILFIFGALGWLMGVTWEYLCSLAVFPTLARNLKEPEQEESIRL